jgi:hypothetical protein
LLIDHARRDRPQFIRPQARLHPFATLLLVTLARLPLQVGDGVTGPPLLDPHERAVVLEKEFVGQRATELLRAPVKLRLLPTPNRFSGSYESQSVGERRRCSRRRLSRARSFVSPRYCRRRSRAFSRSLLLI